MAASRITSPMPSKLTRTSSVRMPRGRSRGREQSRSRVPSWNDCVFLRKCQCRRLRMIFSVTGKMTVEPGRVVVDDPENCYSYEVCGNCPVQGTGKVMDRDLYF